MAPTRPRNRPAKGEPRRAIGYRRISIFRDGKVSPAAQSAGITGYCDSHGLELVDIEEDLGRSGGQGKERPGLESALARIIAGEADVLVVYKLDRVCRSVVDFVDLWRELDAVGAHFVATDSNFNTTDKMGRAMLQIAMVFAELERETIRERARDTIDFRREEGFAPNGRPPYGYSREDGKLVQVPAQAKVVKECVADVLGGMSLRALTAKLNAAKVSLPDAVTSGQWRHQTVRKLLLSPTIAGLRNINDEDGNVVEVVPAVNRSGEPAWKPIVPVETWERLKATLADPARRVTSGDRLPTLLSGILVCDGCGTPLRPKRTDLGVRYRCNAGPQSGGPACGGTSILAADAEPYVEAKLWEVLDGVRVKPLTLPDDDQSDLARLHAQLDRAVELYEMDELDVEGFAAARRVLMSKISRVEQRATTSRRDSAIVQLLGAGALIQDTWADLTVETKRAVIREAFGTIPVLCLGQTGKRSVAAEKLVMP